MASICLVRRPDGRVEASGTLSWFAGYQLPGGGGVYAGWRFADGCLHLSNDRYGCHPLFFWRTTDTMVIATSVQEVLQHGAPADLDLDALSVFVRIGFYVGDDTPFLAVRAVPPAATVEWMPGGPGLTGSHPPAARLDLRREDAIDAFAAAFRRAIHRRLIDGPFELPLSGGRDSRHILLALLQAGCRPSACVTVEHFAPRGQDDRDVAAALCTRFGLRHIVIRQQAPRLVAEWLKNERTSLCSDEHAQFVALGDHLRASTTETYDGIAGDVLTQSSYLTPTLDAQFKAANFHAVAEAILSGEGRAVTDAALLRLLAPDLARELVRDRAVARIVREARRHAGRPNPVASFYFWNRTRREIALAPYALLSPVTMIAPFLDSEVFDLLTALPSELQFDRQFHTDAIARAYPTSTEVPYAGQTLDPGARWPQRGLAAGLLTTTWRASAFVSVRSLAPRLLATVINGNPARLWHASLLVNLAQLHAAAH